MIDVASAKINSFAPVPQNDNVPHSEEPVFILTSSQLQDVITRAIQPALDRIESFQATITQQAEKIAALEATVNTLADNQFIQLRLIHELREATKKDPQPLQKDRGDILRALIAANGGKMLAKDARQKIRLSPSAFSQLIATMKDDIEVKPFNLRKNQKVIILKSCLAKQ